MKNKKLVKGIVAGSLGLALLLGGGTFALWYDTQTVGSGSINSGHLNFSTDATNTKWSYVGNDTGTAPSTDTPTTISDISAFRMVPGDTVIYSTTLHISARGTDLHAQVIANASGISTSNALTTAIAGSSKSTVTVGTGTATALSAPAKFDISSGISQDESAILVPVKITLHFPAATDGDTPSTTGHGNWWHLTAQDQSINLGDLSMTVEQTLGS